MPLTRRGRPPRGTVVLPWILGCGPALSLDEPTSVGSSGTSTGAGPFGVLPGSGGDDDTLDGSVRLDLEGAKLDVAPDVPLPPGSCPPDCQIELGLVWTYDGFARDPLLDPEDRVVVLATPDGTIVVVEEHEGQIVLVGLSEHGQEQWASSLSLPCAPCRLVDATQHPRGDLLISGYGVDVDGSPAALAVRVELESPSLVWATVTALASGAGVAPRAGSLVAQDTDALVQPVIEGAGVDGLERLALLVYDGATGGLSDAVLLDTALVSGDAPAPLATIDTNGALVIASPTWAFGGIEGAVRWLVGPGGEELGSTERTVPSQRLVASPYGRVLTLGQTSEPLQSLLYLDSDALFESDPWGTVYVLPTVTSSRPALAADEHGHVHLVARAASGSRPGHEDAVALEVLRWTHALDPVWKLSLPLALDPVDQPISLAITDDGSLVLGGFVGGARHVEKRAPGCVCD